MTFSANRCVAGIAGFRQMVLIESAPAGREVADVVGVETRRVKASHAIKLGKTVCG